MADFQTQIDDLTGFGSTDDTALVTWLTDGCKEIINVMPENKLVAVTGETGDFSPTGGTNISVPVLGVTRKTAESNGTTFECREIPYFKRYESQDENSILYATETDPIYYIEPQSGTSVNKIKILPSSDSSLCNAVIIHYPTPGVGDSSISLFPDEYENLVVLYASVKALQRLMSDKSNLLPSLPSHIDIDFSDAGNYTLQSIMPDFVDANTWLNTEEDSEMVSSRIQIIGAQLQEYQANVQEELGKFNAEVSKAMQTYQSETGYDMSRYQAELNANINQYQWYQSQYAQLKADYQQGLQLIVGGGQALPQQQRKQARG